MARSKESFEAYIRYGREDNPAGEDGVALPDEYEADLDARLAVISPIRSISSVRKIQESTLQLPSLHGEVDIPLYGRYAEPAATTKFLEDGAVDIGNWIVDEIDGVFAEQETSAFLTGDGDVKPRGLLYESAVAERNWCWGSLGYLPTGSESGLPPDRETDVLIDLVYALKAGYRQNAHWVMNRRSQAALRYLKDADGNYIWQPAPTATGRPTLLGFEIVEAEDMPDFGTGNTPIAFGDFRRGFLVVDRKGVNVIRDPFSAKPHVLFYTTKLVGGSVADYDAIKLLKCTIDGDGDD